MLTDSNKTMGNFFGFCIVFSFFPSPGRKQSCFFFPLPFPGGNEDQGELQKFLALFCWEMCNASQVNCLIISQAERRSFLLTQRCGECNFSFLQNLEAVEQDLFFLSNFVETQCLNASIKVPGWRKFSTLEKNSCNGNGSPNSCDK